jgi:transposase
MRQYIGIDLHKQTSYVTRMNEKGKIVEQINLSNDADTLRGYLTRLKPDARIAVEATGNWMYLYELIEERCPDLVLAHPQKTKAIASARIKTDKIDSTILAHLLRTNLLPQAYIPARQVRDSREVLRYRACLVRLRTSVKNRISALLR